MACCEPGDGHGRCALKGFDGVLQLVSALAVGSPFEKPPCHQALLQRSDIIGARQHLPAVERCKCWAKGFGADTCVGDVI